MEHTCASTTAGKDAYDTRLYHEALERLADVISTRQRRRPARKDEIDINDQLYEALRAINAYYGGEICDQPYVRRRDDLALWLEQFATASNYRFRRVTLKGDWWKKDHGPLLVFTRDGQVAAVLPRSRGTAVVTSPGTVVRTPLSGDTARQLSDIGFVFYQYLPDGQLRFRDVARLCFTRQNSWDMSRALLVALVAGMLGIIVPVLTGYLFDTVIEDGNQRQFVLVAGIFFAVTVAVANFQFIQLVAYARINGRIATAAQSAVLDRLIRLPLTFFKNYSSGDLADRADGIGETLRRLTATAADALFSAAFCFFNFLLLFYYSWKLGAYALLVSGIYIVIVMIGYLAVYKQRKLEFDKSGRLKGFVYQLLGGINKLRTAGAEKRAFFLWARSFAEIRRHAFRASMLAGGLDLFASTYKVLTIIGIYALIAFSFVPGQELSMGEFLAANAAFGALQLALIRLFHSMSALINVLPTVERAKPVLSARPERSGGGFGTEVELSGQIGFQSVTFKYDDDGPLVIKNVSFEIGTGQFVAIVGGSGSGKSTLMKLMLGFVTPTSGSITFDDHDMTTLDISRVRRQFGVVLQSSELVPGSILNNIVGTTQHTINDAWEAAGLAAIDRDITEMPMQMHTVISERADNISGGQKQRLLIAKALVNKPKILIFDEATSALDNQTQAEVMENLQTLKITRLVVAHRLSTVMNADRLLVMDSGRIVQEGSYAALMATEGPFRRLAERQRVS